jgi:hypothetical protein
MDDIIKSRHYRRSRLKNTLKKGLKKIVGMATLVVIGEYMLLNVINASINSMYYHQPFFDVRTVPQQIMDIAVGERPILRVVEAYDTLTKNTDKDKEKDFDAIIDSRYTPQVRGSRPEFRTKELEGKEGAEVGYVLKF